MVGLLPAQNLRGHILQRPSQSHSGRIDRTDALRGPFKCVFFRALGQSKIEDLNETFRGDHNVRTLEVAMDNTAMVRMGQCRGNLHAITQHGFYREPGASYERVQGLTFHQLHDDEQFTGKLTDFVDGADVGMAERGRGARLV